MAVQEFNQILILFFGVGFHNHYSYMLGVLCTDGWLTIIRGQCTISLAQLTDAIRSGHGNIHFDPFNIEKMQCILPFIVLV